MQIYFPIAIIVFAVLLGVAIAIIINRKEGENVENQEIIDQEQEKEQRTRKIIMIILGALVVAGLIAYFLFARKIGDSPRPSSDDDSSIVTFVPVWMAVLIPFIVRRNKKKVSSREQKAIIILILAGVLIFLFGIILAEKNIY